MLFRRVRNLIVVACVAVLASLGVSAQAATGAALFSAAAPSDVTILPPAGTGLAQMNTSSDADSPAVQTDIAAAERTAVASAKPVVVSALTTPTTETLALPAGGLELRENVLPVRVRQGGTWVPVSTELRRSASGMLSAAAVPGDSVTFSPGGTGPLAVISAGGSKLVLSWPHRLPAPLVSGASATYRQVLPGVDLVLTATSEASGGISELIVVHNAAAARNPALAALTFDLSGQGIGPVSVARDGAIAVPGRGGYFSSAAPVMWDSMTEPLATLARNGRALQTADRAVGGFLAGEGSAAGLVSSVAGPGAAARMAAIGVSAASGGRSLVLRPDQAMVKAKSTVFPLYIDPTLTWNLVPGDTENYDDVQSSCVDASHWESYASEGVGYNPWGDCLGHDGYAYALYTLKVPSKIWGEHVCTTSQACAQVEAYETYSGGCSSSYTANVTMSWIGTINKNTDWTNQPAVKGSTASVSVGPDTATNSSGDYTNCDNAENDSGPTYWVPVNFDARPFMTTAASDNWPTITVRLWEQNAPTDGTGWKRFSNNPTLDVEYNDTPNVPSNETLTATSAYSSASSGCVTTEASAPLLGKTASVQGPYMWADFSDPDGDQVEGKFQYWDATKSGAKQTLIAGTGLSDKEKTQGTGGQIPASFISGMTNGDVLGWDATASDGTSPSDLVHTSAPSKPCYVKVDPLSPDAPTVTVTPSGDVAVGSTVTVTMKSASSSDPAVKFVWGFDGAPPTSSPPAAEVCTASSSSCTVASGAATLRLTVPSAGPHSLEIYALDAAGNESAESVSSTITGADTLNSACSDVTFTAAVSGPCGNKMISDSASGSGDANGDGGGRSIPFSEAAAAGWTSGGTVTVDGTSFSLPDFTTTASEPVTGNDNVLAGGQTIDMTGQGSALVFLTTSTNAFASMPNGEATNEQDLDGADLGNDVTAPYVPGGTAVTGDDCSLSTTQDINDKNCQAPTGTVNYASGCDLPAQPFYLTVPDWTSGPSDISVLQTPDRDLSTGPQAASPQLYAFAVPLQPGCQVASVVLPYVGISVSAPVASGVSYNAIPALHIFGMSIRNTTTSTPESDGTQTPATAGQAWTAAFASPVERAYVQPGGANWSKESIRMAVTPGVSAPSGSSLRIRLEDPMFQAGANGTAVPLMIGDATVALQSAAGSPAASTTTQQLEFGSASSPSAMIPEGGDIYSDPLTLNFAVTQGQALLVTLYLENGSGGSGVPAAVADLPSHSFASGAQAWETAPGFGDATGDTTGADFTASGSVFEGADTHILTSVDVTEPTDSLMVHGTDEGMPTIIVAGDNVLNASGETVAGDGPAPDFRIAGQLAGTILASAGDGGEFAPIDEGIESNQLLTDSGSVGGVSLLARLDRDVLSEPDVGAVVIDEGLQDILNAAAPTDLQSAYASLVTELSDQPGFGIPVIVADLTPCGGNPLCTSITENGRCAVNTFLTTESPAGNSCTADTSSGTGSQLNSSVEPAGIVSFDQAVTNGASPEALASGDGESDDVNLTSSGYAAVASALGSQLFSLTANSFTLP